MIIFSQSIQNARDITNLKNAYMDKKTEGSYTTHNPRIGDVVLTFSRPISLHYSRYQKNDIESTTHTVKKLFFTGKDGYANCMHDEAAEAINAYYVAGKSKSRGWPLYASMLQFLQSVEVIEPQAVDYRANWKAIADSMRKHNINPDITEAIEKGIRGENACKNEYCIKNKFSDYHTHFAQNYWDMKNDKPKVMSFADVLRVHDETLASMIQKAGPAEYADGKYTYRHIMKHGQKRDRSVSVQVYPDGKVWYYAASEFAGCGNGDYYTMYSPTMAFYHESD